MTDNLIGQQLDEYRIEDLLGQGGMARVYRGFDVRLERWVAVKVIEASFRDDSDYMLRFEREAKAIAQLEHPHIVSVYRYGEVDGLLYIAMQYIEGSSLDKMLSTYRSEGDFIPQVEARRITEHVCQALDYAHQRGVIHRDIKPANIILDPQGNAYLADFGLALITEEGTQGEIFGTPHYIAPEQAISSAGAVPQSDLYAIGVILYEMFSGELPFYAADALDIAMMHMSDTPPSPSEFNPDLSPHLEKVILKMLEKEPEDRYQSGSELVEAMDQAFKANTQVSLPLPSPEKSILRRVKDDVDNRPLPMMPPGVSTPAPQPSTSESPPPPPSEPQAMPPPQSTSPSPKPTSTTPPPQTQPAVSSGGMGIGVIAAIVAGILILAAIAFFALGVETGEEVTDTTLETALEENETVAINEEAIREAAALPEDNAALTESTAVEAETEATASEVVAPAEAEEAAVMEQTAEVVTATEQPENNEVVATPTLPEPTSYELLLATRKDESFFILNQSSVPFPLSPLQLEGERGRSFTASEWGVDALQPNQCVSAWKDKGKVKAPDDMPSCDEISKLSLEGKERFWKDGFELFYNGTSVGNCEGDSICEITISQ